MNENFEELGRNRPSNTTQQSRKSDDRVLMNRSQSSQNVNFGESRDHIVFPQNSSAALPAEPDFTEVFSWGSDRFGQLGLGQQI